MYIYILFDVLFWSSLIYGLMLLYRRFKSNLPHNFLKYVALLIVVIYTWKIGSTIITSCDTWKEGIF